MIGNVIFVLFVIGQLYMIIAVMSFVKAASHLEGNISIMYSEKTFKEKNLRHRILLYSHHDSERNNVLQKLHDKNNCLEAYTSNQSENNELYAGRITLLGQPQIRQNRALMEVRAIPNPKAVSRKKRSITVIRTFLKTMKNTFKTFKPEIKLSECAQKYFFSPSESEASYEPPHKQKKKKEKDKKKKKKHEHDHEKNPEHITDEALSSILGVYVDIADTIYQEYRPYLHSARFIYKYLKSSLETLQRDALMKCTIDYFTTRFCKWVDG